MKKLEKKTFLRDLETLLNCISKKVMKMSLTKFIQNSMAPWGESEKIYQVMNH